MDSASAERRQALPRWLIPTGVAIAASLAHVLIDHHLGLYGPQGTELTVLQAGAVLANAIIFGGWMTAAIAAGSGHPGAHLTLMVFTVVEAVLLNGLVAMLVAPPPSDAFPYQDAAHVLALGAGVLSTVQLRGTRPPGRSSIAWLAGGIAVLVIGNTVISALQVS